MPISTDRIKSLRKNKGITQKDLAQALGIADRNYRRYEAGEVDPATSTSEAIADYFDVSLDYLVGRSNDPLRRP